MKNTLLFFLLFVCASLPAQRVATIDTVYRVNVNGVFFSQHDIVYSNGETFNERLILGDTATFQATEIDKTEQYAGRATNDAQFVSLVPKGLRDLNRLSDQMGTITGTTTLRSIQAKYDTNFINHAWSIKDDSSQIIVFTKSAQGQLRYKIGNLATRNATIYGSTLIVLNNYRESGRDVMLYRFPGYNAFKDIYRKINLKRNDQSQSLRSRLPGMPEEDEAAPVSTKSVAPAPVTTKKTTKKKSN